jgi:hypothetical protein
VMAYPRPSLLVPIETRATALPVSRRTSPKSSFVPTVKERLQ